MQFTLSAPLMTLITLLFLFCSVPSSFAKEATSGTELVAPPEAVAIAKSISRINDVEPISGRQNLPLCKMIMLEHSPEVTFISLYIFNAQNNLLGISNEVNQNVDPYYFYSQLDYPAVVHNISGLPNFWFDGRYNLMVCDNHLGIASCFRNFVC